MSSKLGISILLLVFAVLVYAQQPVRVVDNTSAPTGPKIAAESDAMVCPTDTRCIVAGPAADGAAVSGNPVRIGGKDGSGNTQDILTDAGGAVQMDVESFPDDEPVLAKIQAVATGGADGLSYISAGSTEDEHAVKATPGTLYSVTATNTNAAVRYLKCENDTAANTAPGTDTPELRIAIPGATTGAGFTVAIPSGYSFSVALTCWLVTGAADSDVAEVAANEIMVFYAYK